MDSEEEVMLNEAVQQTEAEEIEITTAAPDVAAFPGPSTVTPDLTAVRAADQAAAAPAAAPGPAAGPTATAPLLTMGLPTPRRGEEEEAVAEEPSRAEDGAAVVVGVEVGAANLNLFL
ncbi:hypothetical protein FQR65_LT15663 [Abscondita terminalis]|nr:hypothetical protein FQR65_LT15663 [Abscondita terminalis]